MATKTITAKQQMHAAQSFAFFSSVSVILLPTIFPMFLWIAASIFVYASLACHPNAKICDYVKYSGYRFYGVVGGLVALLNFSSQLSKLAGGTLNLILIVWIVSILIVVPFGVRDILRAKREPWQDMQVETD
ncbi:MAG: hypothetical protein ACAH12_02785 [Methylophilaceae bacterium]|uniref:hypothetical protein n=1 Tax=Methylovorus sp. MM2 TaxID=1848038 RepID=UPI0007E1333F|nr:hypothetical protein [Methylovorus sp. MM2]OAM51429.1 hypothetical protein A7981_07965 [Methylovorus sp. MM2]